VDLADILADGYHIEFEDDFDAEDLDRAHWLPHYLPHWSSRERSKALYQIEDGLLHLLIEEAQAPWCPELDGETRVSSLQTGAFSGEAGSTVGQHRFTPGAVVREAQDALRLYTPRYGLFQARARGLADSACMVSLWMIGFEDRPERSGEICVFEIFGRNVRPGSALVGMGVHPFDDPSLDDDFAEVLLPIDVTEFHEYAVEWAEDHVSFFVDGGHVRTTEQSPSYPMQFMLGIYEFARTDTAGGYPKRFTVDFLRGYRRQPSP
jgi:hypothetical protein